MDLSNISIGVDIEENIRFKGLDRNKDSNFLKKIFTDLELDYCFSKKEPAALLAVRFAAKEAIIKAVSTFEDKPPSFNKIEVKKNKKNVPYFEIEGYDSKLTLSHCKDKSLAFVIILKK